jgi:hypothetical protein
MAVGTAKQRKPAMEGELGRQPCCGLYHRAVEPAVSALKQWGREWLSEG